LRHGDRYDIVILDPPAFAKSRGQTHKALGLYQSLNRDAMNAVEHGGYLITSSCSHFVDLPAFLEMLKRASRAAQRNAWIVETRGAAKDHPVLMAMPETAYLKCVMLRVF
jgi:23S rRNA (cytosine1962-C5)-methyltransferase